MRKRPRWGHMLQKFKLHFHMLLIHALLCTIWLTSYRNMFSALHAKFIHRFWFTWFYKLNTSFRSTTRRNCHGYLTFKNGPFGSNLLTKKQTNMFTHYVDLSIAQIQLMIHHKHISLSITFVLTFPQIMVLNDKSGPNDSPSKPPPPPPPHDSQMAIGTVGV